MISSASLSPARVTNPPTAPPMAGPAAAPSAARAATEPRRGDAAPEGAGSEMRAGAPRTQLRIEPALQLLVMEFRKPDGEIQRSIPTPREIDAYRNAPPPDAKPAAAPLLANLLQSAQASGATARGTLDVRR